jgi:hypothetical protein
VGVCCGCTAETGCCFGCVTSTLPESGAGKYAGAGEGDCPHAIEEVMAIKTATIVRSQ